MPADLWDALAFALRVVDGDLPGGRWCDECGIRTNHTTAQHQEAENAQERNEP